MIQSESLHDLPVSFALLPVQGYDPGMEQSISLMRWVRSAPGCRRATGMVASLCVLALLLGSAVNAATPCTSMAMHDGATAMDMHAGGHSATDIPSASTHDDHGCCHDGGSCSMTECAAPAGICTSPPPLLLEAAALHRSSLALPCTSASITRFFRPPINA